MNIESVVFKLISLSGEAKSLAMEAIFHAKEGKFEEANKAIEESSRILGLAHKEQTSLIQSEARGEEITMTLLVVHAQDHLMTSMTTKDLAKEMVELYEKIGK